MIDYFNSTILLVWTKSRAEERIGINFPASELLIA